MSKQFSCRIGKREGMQYKDVPACQEFAEKIAPIFTVGKTAQDLRRLFGFLDFFVWLPGREKICLRFHACLKSANAATVPPVSIPSQNHHAYLVQTEQTRSKSGKVLCSCLQERGLATYSHTKAEGTLERAKFANKILQTLQNLDLVCTHFEHNQFMLGQPLTLLQRQPILSCPFSQSINPSLHSNIKTLKKQSHTD